MKDTILSLIKNKQPRYITKKYLGDNLYNYLIQKTSFLKENSKISERLYCLYNNITNLSCNNCKATCNNTNFYKFDVPTYEYKNIYCCRKCNGEYRDVGMLKQNTKEIPLIELSNFYNIVENQTFKEINKTLPFLNTLKYECSKKFNLNEISSMKEIFYLIKNKINNIPKCVCGNKVAFLNNKYSEFCSCKCAANYNETRNKCTNTLKEKYGVDNCSRIPESSNKRRKTKLEKYGSETYNNIEKIIETNNLKSPKEKQISLNKKILSTYKNTYKRFNRFKNEVIPLFNEDEFNGGGYDKLYKWKCLKCNSIFYHWYDNGSTPTCNCMKDINILNQYIDTLGSYTSNNRKIILFGDKKLELDFYFPKEKIAIEYNGNYWHSKLDRKYHLTKTELCKEKGIQLIHIFEDEWINKQQIVKNRLNNLFNKTQYKIYARKCEIKEIDVKLKNKFLNKYHLQGEDKSKIKLGLFYKNRLVAVMTFCKRRFDNKEGYELIRYCTVGRFRILGGAGKLLKYFERNYKPEALISYADKRYSNGSLYFKIGFKHTHNSAPNYWYMKSNYLNRISRIQFQKHKLKDKLDVFDNNISEWKNMKNNGYSRIWDCGNMVFVKNFN